MKDLIKPLMLQQVVHIRVRRSTPFFPQHLRCRRVIFIADDILISFSLLWISSWLYPCTQTRFNSQLNRVTHRCCSSPDSIESFDRSFIISIEHYYSSFQLPGLYSSGAFVFSWDNRNSRRELEEVASVWITEVYRGRQLPSEKLKVVCRKVYPCHKRRRAPYLCILLQCLHCDHLWMSEFVETAGRLRLDSASRPMSYMIADYYCVVIIAVSGVASHSVAHRQCLIWAPVWLWDKHHASIAKERDKIATVTVAIDHVCAVR